MHARVSPGRGGPLPNSEGSLLAFGPFRLDVRGRRLLRGQEVVPVSPRAFDILAVLVHHAGQTVTKQDLMQQVWPDVFVEEANLAQHVSQLRRLLGDATKQPEYIATIPRQGYQFVAVVTPVAEVPSVGEASPAPQTTAPAAEDPPMAAPPVAGAETPAAGRWFAAYAWLTVTLIVVVLLSSLGSRSSRLSAASAVPEAQRAFELGLYQLNRNTPQTSVLAQVNFAEAVRLDPAFAGAHAHLSLAYVAMYLGRRLPLEEARESAEAAADRALALDANSADAHTARGAVRLQLRGDALGARAALQRATALDRTNVRATDLLARALRHDGRHAESIAVARQQVDLEPSSIRAYMNLAQSLMFAGTRQSLDEALSVARDAMLLESASPVLFGQAADIAEAAGHLDEAIAYRAQSERLSQRPALADLLERMFAERGYAAANAAYLEAKLAATGNEAPSDGFERVRLLARLGRVDAAFAAWDQALTHEFSLGVFALRWHPAFRALAADPRFTDYVERSIPR
jgi:DNA-binding winged helix-turn-helix (wHTH) protein/tetratricopeptide (TPR) repeat protein